MDFFPLSSGKTEQEPGPLFTLTGIRLAEACECSENAEVILPGIEIVIEHAYHITYKIAVTGSSREDDCGNTARKTMNADAEG